jgi:phosphate butyryltransferase
MFDSVAEIVMQSIVKTTVLAYLFDTPQTMTRGRYVAVYANFEELRGSMGVDVQRTLVVAAAHDAHTLEAVYDAAKVLPMRYVLVGNREEILTISSGLDNVPDESAIVDVGDNADCAVEAVKLVREGRGDVLMKGNLETGVLLKAVLDKESGIRDSHVMTHLALLEILNYHKLVAVTDGGILTNPTLEQKAEIIRSAVSFYRRLGFNKPNIAALCASETVSEKMPETVEAGLLQKMCEAGELGDCIVEGPISFDLAISPKSAEEKGYVGKFTGEVDIFLVPNITVGNVLCKGLIYLSGAKMAGCVMGAKVPIVLVSRAATAEEKLLSIMLCLRAG